jgi:hypothetical protein
LLWWQCLEDKFGYPYSFNAGSYGSKMHRRVIVFETDAFEHLDARGGKEERRAT